MLQRFSLSLDGPQPQDSNPPTPQRDDAPVKGKFPFDVGIGGGYSPELGFPGLAENGSCHAGAIYLPGDPDRDFVRDSAGVHHRGIFSVEKNYRTNH